MRRPSLFLWGVIYMGKSKIDRQGVRTATDLERKYKFGQDLTEISNIANNASRMATNAQNTAHNALSVAAEAKSTAQEIATGLSVVDGLLCITYEG